MDGHLRGEMAAFEDVHALSAFEDAETTDVTS
jgi:hypothetical protein